MEKLADPSIFDHSPLKMIFNREGLRHYHTMSQSGIRRVFLLPSQGNGQPLYVVALFRGKVDTRYHYRQEKDPGLGVEYIREGRLAVRQQDRCYLLEPGEVFLLLPGENNEVMTPPGGYCVKDSFHVQGKLLKPFLAATGLDRRDCICNFDWLRFEQIIDRLEELSGDGSDGTAAENSILTYELLELLAYPAEAAKPEQEIIRLLDFMRNNLKKPLSVEALIRESGCSRMSLNRKFRMACGKTPHQMLIELRMKEAAKLLVSGKRFSIKEIAQMTGYQDLMNFSTAFRRFYGACPREYRRMKNRS